LTFALTTCADACNQLALIWGVMPFHDKKLNMTREKPALAEGTMFDLLGAAESDATEEMLKTGEATLLEATVVQPGETIIMLAGRLSGLGLSSSVVVWTIGEEVPRR
jgi:pyruvate kinase